MNREPLTTALLLALLAGFGCHRTTINSGPLPQRGYLWQRAWNSAVTDAVREADRRMDGLVILGAEIVWVNHAPVVVRSTIDWDVLKTANKPVALALRVDPYPGPFSGSDPVVQTIVETSKSLLLQAESNGLQVSEFQLDFDCAQKKLSGYQLWLDILRPAVQPSQLVITTLPSWLDEPEFAVLVRHIDGYVLQVHSVPTLAGSGRSVLCDTALARKWVGKAARLKHPFSVALPTYRCSAGYGPTGSLIAVAMDSVVPPWPPGTRVLDFSTDADDLAALIKEWQSAHPSELKEVLWYRVPVATDERNWRWATLAAVMGGRAPVHRLTIQQRGENPVDLSISNSGEANRQNPIVVNVSWNHARLIAWDTLPGWTVRIEKDRAVFSQLGHSQLSPGDEHSIGWLRYDQVTTVRSEVEETPPL